MRRKQNLFGISLSIISYIFLIFYVFLSYMLIDAFHHFYDNNNKKNGDITLGNFGKEEFDFQERHYIIYNINPAEGFNLRRDVYMRVANVVRQLRERGKIFFMCYHYLKKNTKFLIL